MFDPLLILTLFLLASLRVCLLTFTIKQLCLFFSFITAINGFFEIPTPPVYQFLFLHQMIDL